MTAKDLREEIETRLMRTPLLTASFLAAAISETTDATHWDVKAAIRQLKGAGRLIEIEGMLMLQRGEAIED